MADKEIIFQDSFFSIIKGKYHKEPGDNSDETIIIPEGSTRFWLCNSDGNKVYGNELQKVYGFLEIHVPSEGVVCAQYSNEEWFFIDQGGYLLNNNPYIEANDFKNGQAIVTACKQCQCVMDHYGNLYISDSNNILKPLPDNCLGACFLDDDHIAVYERGVIGNAFYLYDREYNPIKWHKTSNVQVNFESFDKGPLDWCCFLYDCEGEQFDFLGNSNSSCLCYNLKLNKYNCIPGYRPFKDRTPNIIGQNCIYITNDVDYIDEYEDENFNTITNHIKYTEDILLFKSGEQYDKVRIIEVNEENGLILMHDVKREDSDVGYCGCVNFEGAVIVKNIYSSIQIREKYIEATFDKKWTFTFDLKGSIIYKGKNMPKGIDAYESLENGVLLVYKISIRKYYNLHVLFGVINEEDFSVIIPTEYKAIDYHKDAIIVCKEIYENYTYKYKYGVLDNRNNEVIPCKYDKLIYLNDNAFVRKIEGGNYSYDRYGIIDRKQDVIVPCSFKSYSIEEDGSCHLYHNENNKDYILLDSKLNTSYVDSEGNKIVYNNQYDSIYKTSISGYYVGVKDGSCYLIDTNKQTETRTDFSQIESYPPFSLHNLFIVHGNKGCGLIKPNLEVVIDCVYKEIEIKEWSDGGYYHIIYGSFTYKHGLLDLEGNVVIPCKYQSLHLLSNGNIIAKGDYATMFSPSGNMIVCENDRYNDLKETGCDCIKSVVKKENGNIKFGIISRSGEVLHRANLSFIDDFIDGYAIINDCGIGKRKTIQYAYTHINGIIEERTEAIKTIVGGHYGIIDNKGHLLVEPKYTFIFRKRNGYYVVCENDLGRDKYGILDSKGHIIIPCRYSYIRPIENDLYVYAIEGKWSDSGKVGERVIVNGNRRLFLNDAKWGIAKISGGDLFEPFADFINSISENKVTFRVGETFGVIDLRTCEKTRTIYNYMSVFKEGMCVVGLHLKNGPYDFGIKFGYVNSSLEQVLPCEYMSASNFKNGEGHVEALVGSYNVNHSGEIFVEGDNEGSEFIQDNWDWEKENWDALTDGQYGDYPGPGVDYDALGF